MAKAKQANNREKNDVSNLRQDQRELLEKIVNDHGDCIFVSYGEEIQELKYGDFLIFAWWKEAKWKPEMAVFRLLQIREEQGEFGSHLLFGRLAGGECVQFHNTSVFRVKEEYLDDLRLVYDTHDAIEIDDDHKDIGYTINGVKKVGFFIPSSEF